MELQIISESISAVGVTKGLSEKNRLLEMELVSVNNLFSEFKRKVRQCIYEKCTGYENKIRSLNQRIEELEMVYNK